MKYLCGLLVFVCMMYGNSGFANEWVSATTVLTPVVVQPVANYTVTYYPVVRQELVWTPVVVQQPVVVYEWVPVYRWAPLYSWQNDPYRNWIRSRQYRY